MKKLFLFIFVLTLFIVSFSSCGSSEQADKTANDSTEVVLTVPQDSLATTNDSTVDY